MKSIMPALGCGLTAGDAAHTGRLGAQPRLRDGVLLDDRVGYAPVLLTRGEVWRGETGRCGLDPSVSLLLDDGEPAIAACLAQFDCVAVLLRPDRYILGTARNGDQLAALCGAALPSPLETKTSETV